MKARCGNRRHYQPLLLGGTASILLRAGVEVVKHDTPAGRVSLCAGAKR